MPGVFQNPTDHIHIHQNPSISLSFDFPCLGPILVIFVTGVIFSIGTHPMHARGPPEPDRTHTHTSEPTNISQFRFWIQNPCLGPILVVLVTGVIFSIGSHPVHAPGTPGPDRTHTKLNLISFKCLYDVIIIFPR